MRDREAEMLERFEAETAEHEMTVLRDDGVYRHVRFARPGSSFYLYDLVTWPGHLVVCGDAVDFFAADGKDARGINPGYWAQKLQGGDGRRGAQSFSEDAYRACVLEWFADEARAILGLDWRDPVATTIAAFSRWWVAMPYGGDEPDAEGLWDDERFELLEQAIALRDAVEDQLFEPALDWLSEERARTLLQDFEHDGRDLHYAWEWDLREWDHQFLWCCWAIVRGIERYRAHVAQEAATHV